MTSMISAMPGVNPAPAALTLPAEQFNPVIHRMTQFDAIEAVQVLREHTFTEIGSAELHTGIHPVYGKCIISIYGEHASLIPFA